jgi:hypothetical protein
MNNTSNDFGTVENTIPATPRTHIECALSHFHHREFAGEESVTTEPMKDGAS